MKNIYIVLTAAMMLLASCKEFQPVFTGEYADPAPYEVVTMEPTHTIAELAAMYVIEKPWVIDEDIIIEGKVSTTDQPGNFYKSFYIQDETGGMEIKIGKNGLYNDYKPGQTVYVKCQGMSLGMYGWKKPGTYNGEPTGGCGMVQLGYEDPTEEYETSYLEIPVLIDKHIKRGAIGEEVQPVVITEADLPGREDTQEDNPYIGRLVTLKGLRYANETFTLMYLDSNKDKKASSNRIFLSDQTWGITTWAMSEAKMKEYLYSGIWDNCKLGNSGDQNYGTVGDRRVVDEVTGEVSYPDIEKAAYSVSQYFKMGGTEIQIRSSGYSKFADTEIDPAVLSGAKTIDVTGVLTLYQGNIQFVVNNITDIIVNE